MCTAKNARKLTALQRYRAVALTIDTEVHPPDVLLLRGEAALDPVDGIADEYLHAFGTYQITPEQRQEWEAEIKSLYVDGMVRIMVRPTWAKLIDFETTHSPVRPAWREIEQLRAGASRGPDSGMQPTFCSRH